VYYLTENPTLVLASGGLILLMLAVGFYHTRNARVLLAMVAVFLLTAGLWLVEWLVVTDSEAIRHVLRQVANAVVRGDAAGVRSHLAGDADELSAAVDVVLAQFDIQSIHFTGEMKIRLDRRVQPPSAVAQFGCLVNGQALAADIPYRVYRTRLQVQLTHDGDVWQISHADQIEPRRGRRRNKN